MPNNLFYKTLSIIGTLGIVVLSSTQVWTTFKKQNNSEAEISKTLSELKKARKETLSEINLIKKEVLKELNSLSTETLDKVETFQKSTLSEVKTVKSDLLNELDYVRVNSVKEIKADRVNALTEVKAAKQDALKTLNAATNEDAKIWLVMRSSVNQGGNTIQKIPFSTMERCQEAELELESSDGFAGRNRFFFTMCIDAR